VNVCFYDKLCVFVFTRYIWPTWINRRDADDADAGGDSGNQPGQVSQGAARVRRSGGACRHRRERHVQAARQE